MATILDEIISKIKIELETTKELIPIEELKDEIKTAKPSKGFKKSLESQNTPRIISELKKASPSKGIIREKFDIFEIAREYEEAGAAALSILTEKNYFLGSPDYLQAIASNSPIPVLRKDFIVDRYQVYEAKAWGADAILLIAAALTPENYKALYELAKSIDLDVLSEVHNIDELDMVLTQGAEIVGVNSRNLKTFKTDLDLMETMLNNIPEDVVKVAESGIKTSEDIRRMMDNGTNAFLIGEALMKEHSPGKKLEELIAGTK
jgi:indole-3-glycerol phosphate synthase